MVSIFSTVFKRKTENDSHEEKQIPLSHQGLGEEDGGVQIVDLKKAEVEKNLALKKNNFDYDREVGVTDESEISKENDTLNFLPYVDGLGSFIKECRTPMTIAIQGDWGSGKTSFMNMISNNIFDSCETIWINTWQYSQFKLDESLQLMFLTKIIKRLSGDAKTIDSQTIISALRVLSQITHTITGVNLDGLFKIADEERASKDIIDSLEEIKKSFNIIVDSRIAEINKQEEEKFKKDSADIKRHVNRIVIFVDDLDRLHPAKAVEILEILKVFLDCKKCVFVLAIDYDVVINGIRLKYENTLDNSKSKEFFDKLIQLPFKMPINKYDINEFMRDQFSRMKIELDEGDLNKFIELINASIVFNPRTMKRYFNIFELDYKIKNSLKEIPEGEEDSFITNLAYSLCIQMAFPDIYLHLNKQKNMIETAVLCNAIEHFKGNEWGEDLQELINWMRQFNANMQEDYVRKVGVFFAKIFEVLGVDLTDYQPGDNMVLSKIFQMNSSVAINQSDVPKSNNEDIIRDVKAGEEDKLVSVEVSNVNYQVEDGYEYINLADERALIKSTWNKSKVAKIRYDDGDMSFSEDVNSYAHALAIFLTNFYKDNPDNFKAMVNQHIDGKLRVLFSGSSREGGFESTKIIHDSGIPFETKTNSYYKVFNMVTILEVLEKKPEKMELLVKFHNE